MKQTAERKTDKTKWLILLLALITAIAVGVSIWALLFREPAKDSLAPDYAPVEEEKNAEDLIKKMKMFGHDAKGLYALNQELAARVYTASVNAPAM